MSRVIIIMLLLSIGASLKGQDASTAINMDRYARSYKVDSAEGNYLSAIRNHIKYKTYFDSMTDMDQRKKMDELTIKYATEKKDQDIKILLQREVVRKVEFKKKVTRRNILIGGTGILLLIGGLVFRQSNLKKKTSRLAAKKNLALQHLIQEKEWLLKEVHHRVKNNLQTVICLLESQARHLEDDALKAINVSQHRIYTMSLIHQQLYLSEDAKTVDMAIYLPEFIRYLDDIPGGIGKIRFRLDIPPLKLGIGQAIPVALIINEAVTNAIKYAFPETMMGIIDISIRLAGNEATLRIADNGIGIDPTLPGELRDSLGLTLIKGFCEEIHGMLHIGREAGTIIMVVFNIALFDSGEITQNIGSEQEAYL